ncbi:MAG: alanine dehydrogenase [Cyclobacteriaceae bacterium]
MEGHVSGFSKLAREHQHYTQEAPLKIKTDNTSIKIGIPKEIDPEEKRIPLTPNAVNLLINNGHEVLIESGAGNDANYSDRDYTEAGGQISYNTKEIYEGSDVILKVDPPSLENIEWMKVGSTLISALQLPKLTKEHIVALNKKKITSLGFELIEDKGCSKPVIRSMSEIAGCCVLSIAAEHLSNLNDGMGIILGGITGNPPAKVVVLGAGTAAEHIVRGALGLGANVQVFDKNHYKLRRLQTEIGQPIYTCILEPTILANELESADVVVGAIRPEEEGLGLCVVTEEMVYNMKHGAVVIDITISEGGCFETSKLTSHSKPVYEVNGIKHYCVPNIPSRVSRTASRAFSNILTPMLLKMGEYKNVEEISYNHPWFAKGIYTYKGCLTKHGLAKRFGISFKTIDLLFAPQF